MLYNNKFNCIIRNSSDNYYRFYIEHNKNLIVEEYNSTGLVNNTVVSQSVLDYSADIDENDSIHLIYLSADGNLKYSIYPGNYKNKILFHFDMRNDNIYFLSLKLLLSDIHIFYMIGHKSNSFQSTIKHYMWHDAKWISEKIFDVTFPKYPSPFFIEFDNKNNLYVFASKNCKNIYCIKKYSPEFNIWVDLEDSLIIDGADNVSFFVTDKDIAIISYNQSINKNIQTFIKYKDLTKLSSSWSYSVLISNTNSIRPSVFTKNNYIYIMWEEGSNFVYRKSSDITINWGVKKILTAKNDYIINSVYRSNNLRDSSFKSSFLYMSINNYPYSIIDTENLYTNSNKIISPSKDTNKVNEIPTKVTYTKSIENNDNNPSDNFKALLSERDKKIEDLNKIASNLSEQLNNLSQQYYNKDLIIQKLTSELKEINYKYEGDVKEYNKIIENLSQDFIPKIENSKKLDVSKNSIFSKLLKKL